MGMIKKIWKITKFDTWNVHGLLDPEKLAIVERNILDTTNSGDRRNPLERLRIFHK